MKFANINLASRFLLAKGWTFSTRSGVYYVFVRPVKRGACPVCRYNAYSKKIVA
jgi:hypothetical protein